MDSSTRSEIRSIKKEIENIVKELNDISDSVNRDFKNIGNERCSKSIGNVAEKYQKVANRLGNLL